jgi:hypothetical protein
MPLFGAIGSVYSGEKVALEGETGAGWAALLG